MYDTVKFILSENDLENKVCFMEEIACRISVKSCSMNSLKGYLDNMRVEVRDTILIVMGSLHKYLKGCNCIGYLSKLDIAKSLIKLSDKLGVPMEKAKVVRIDIGVSFRMEYSPWMYLSRLLSNDGFVRSSINKETLYFKKHDFILCFYDKKAEMKVKRELKGNDLKGMELLRYEFRIMKVSKALGRVVKGKDLYNSELCIKILNLWYSYYVSISKYVDMDLFSFRLDGKEAFKLCCVAYTMGKLDIFSFLEEAFAQGTITSKNKYDVKVVMKKAEKLANDIVNYPILIKELNVKIDNAYKEIKSVMMFGRRTYERI